MKIKKRLSQNVLHPKSFVSNFWGAVHFETASSTGGISLQTLICRS
jgi:hypothetical protein